HRPCARSHPSRCRRSADGSRSDCRWPADPRLHGFAVPAWTGSAPAWRLLLRGLVALRGGALSCSQRAACASQSSEPFLIDFTLQELVSRLCAFVAIAGVRGAAIAAAACALGDQGPRHDGRLRLNPLAHLDLLGTVSGVLFSVGWAKPVAVDPLE